MNIYQIILLNLTISLLNYKLYLMLLIQKLKQKNIVNYFVMINNKNTLLFSKNKLLALLFTIFLLFLQNGKLIVLKKNIYLIISIEFKTKA